MSDTFRERLLQPEPIQKGEFGANRIWIVVVGQLCFELVREFPDRFRLSSPPKNYDINDIHRALSFFRLAWKDYSQRNGTSGNLVASQLSFKSEKKATEWNSKIEMDPTEMDPTFERMIANFRENREILEPGAEAENDDVVDVGTVCENLENMVQTKMTKDNAQAFGKPLQLRRIQLLEEFAGMAKIALIKSNELELETKIPKARKLDDGETDFSKKNWFTQYARDPPSYEDACSFLEIDPRDPVLVEGIKFTPCQLQGIAHMAKTEYTQFPSGLIADDRGLGKTLQELGFIYIAANRMKAPYRPTLVIAPCAILDVWESEARRFFDGKLTFRMYYRSKIQGSDPYRKDITVDENNLGPYLASLDRNDVETARTIILTSYSTWSGRTWQFINNDGGSNDGYGECYGDGNSDTGISGNKKKKTGK